MTQMLSIVLMKTMGIMPCLTPPPKPLYAPNARFPCPLEGHKHEMSECVTFLSMKLSERWDQTRKNRICYACLHPKLVSIGRTCTFEASVPDILVCQGWVEFSKKNCWAPFSIFMCKKESHETLRAQYTEVKKQLISIWVNLTPKSMSQTLRYLLISCLEYTNH